MSDDTSRAEPGQSNRRQEFPPARSSPAVHESQQCVGYAPIAEYAVVGDCRSAALISRSGAIDWYCPGRFDAPALFCRLLDADHGGYLAAIPRGHMPARRRYLGDTNVLETVFRGDGRSLTYTDFMPVSTAGRGSKHPDGGRDIVRLLEVEGGTVDLDLVFKPTPDFARGKVQLRCEGSLLLAEAHDVVVGVGLPDGAEGEVDGQSWRGDARLDPGVRTALRLHVGRTREEVVDAISHASVDDQLQATLDFWQDWSERCTYDGPYRMEVVRSALALKLLTYDPSGAVVAAPTMSLPEEIGGTRNWDYRYTWLRDSTLILYALHTVGYDDEARRFLDWLCRAVAHDPTSNPQIMYTVGGEAHIPEIELDQLEGYCASRPVRLGNAAAQQCQLDIYGEVLTAAYIHFHRDKHHGTINPNAETWTMLRGLVDDAAAQWQNPDEGIWEVRGGPQQFVYSKVMCWAAIDRGIRLAEEHALEGDIERWRATRDDIRRAVESNGYNQKVGAFTQAFDSDTLDASVLVIPRIGFLPATDPRFLSTLDAIQKKLVVDGMVYRYRDQDGLPGGEGAFLLCNFWLVDALALAGRLHDAHRLFAATARLANDVGLFAEEVDPRTGTLLGNFPQGFSHLALLRSAVDLATIDLTGPESDAHTEGERAHRARHAVRAASTEGSA